MTIGEARAALIAALEAADIAATDVPGARDVPYVLVSAAGVDVGHLLRGAGTAQFRARCIAGAWDTAAAVATLDGLKLGVLGVMRALPGWRVLSVGDDGIRTHNGAELLTADCAAATSVEI